MKELLKGTEDKMGKTIATLKKDFASLRAGRATPGLLEKVTVEYYGTPSPIHQVASVSVPDARTIVIQPWDKSMIKVIEKAILASDLGLTPSNDGVVIRLTLPQLTEQRRKELVKVVHKKGEEAKVAIRNLRRDCNDALKAKEKAGDLTEDENKRAQEESQKLTDKYIKEVDLAVQHKEKEVMEV